MHLVDWILIGLLLMILGGAALYIYRAKKGGKKCIGCPSSASCNSQCAGCGCSKKD